jgi:CRISPR-associated protein Cmr3
MTAQTWRFTPLDSCFFRESRPMDTIGGSELTSSFPPPIRTLLGAIRTAIGEYNGVDWDNYLRGDQYAPLREQLGTSNNLAEIEINGPWLVQKNDGQWQRLYPVPLNQIGSMEQGTLKIFSLQPGDPCRCDLGENVRMAMPPEGLKKGTSLAEYWITGETLEQLLSTSGNTIPQNKLIPATDLFTEEPRLGIARDNQLRAVEEGQLYQTRHIRPKPGVAIEVDLQGVTENQHFKLPQEGIIRLGAEARGAAFKVWPSRQAALTLPHPPYHKEAKGIMLTLLSPTAVQPAADGGYAPLPGFSRQEVGGRTIWKGTINGDSYTLHCAITGKVLREGGWDMQVHQPRTVQSYIPSGSVFYCTPDEITLAVALEKLHLAQLEQPEPIDQQLGRGRIIASLWIDRKNNS